MNIAGHEIGVDPFIIAEVGLNANGSIHRAFEMIEVAKAAGCTAVKFQTFRAVDVCPPDQMYTYQQREPLFPPMEQFVTRTITEPRINLFKRAEFSESAWPIIKAECDRVGIIFLSTPETPHDLDILLKVGIPAIKIGSDNLTNRPLLRHCFAPDVGLPIILSCGMSDILEINAALSLASSSDLILMICTSEYPCPRESTNLRRIPTLKNSLAWPLNSQNRIAIGFSDHTQGTIAAITSVGLGACVFEKHFTLSLALPGPDHWWSCNPKELSEWVSAIRTAHTMLGDGVMRPSAKELEAKKLYQRTVPT